MGEGEEIPAIFPVTRLKAAGSSLRIPILSGSMLAAGRGILPDDPVSLEKHPKATFYPGHTHKDYRWALAVDLDRCTGCGACVSACYVENNIPVTGADEHARGREMSWLRIEPFFNEKQRLEFIPMMCQQCDNAPCEPVCPVIATYHTPEGLNVQVYNRCVGTRYCSNNCPYKARRFNWLDHPLPGASGLMTNPDLLLFDEPSEGLAPVVVDEVFRVIRELKAAGESILLVEQDFGMAMSVADYTYVMSKGTVVYESTPEQLIGPQVAPGLSLRRDMG